MRTTFFRISLTLAVAAITFSLAVSAQAQTEKIIYTFPSPGTDGTSSSSPYILDASGSLYGTSPHGGSTANSACGVGCGVVYKLSNVRGTWTDTVLHTFTGRSDGGVPAGKLVFDGGGNLYGVTADGGNLACKNADGTKGCGIVYELSRYSGGGWKITVLYSFTGGADGANPAGGLVLDAAGNLYGQTANGGDTTQCGVGCGVVYELSPSSSGWTETVLHTFEENNIDGITGTAELTFDSAGNLYGETSNGGSVGFGTVFQLSPSSSGWNETILHNFSGTFGSVPDGWNPSGGVLIDSAGNLFGSTILGGNTTSCPGTGCGLVFELSPVSSGWQETILTSAAYAWDGAFMNGIARDSAGNIYFTTSSGGNNPICQTSEGCGTVVKLTASSGYLASVLHRFAGPPDGTESQAGVVVDSAGNLWGSAPGGEPSYGIAYEIKQ